GVGEGHLLHRKALRVKSADFAKSGSLFQSFPRACTDDGLFILMCSAATQYPLLPVNQRYL
ncbi:hypothetical protein ACRCQV_27150, partial [Pseudomonas aeruginosa]